MRLDTSFSAASSTGWAPAKVTVYNWSIQLSRALAFVHNCKPLIVHRDLKPCNLLLDRVGNLKVCDFGLAKIKDKIDCNDEYRMTGQIGSFGYMAPEVFLDNPQYTESIDIYSAGMLMWFMVTGVQPFSIIPPRAAATAAAIIKARPDLSIINNLKRHSILMSVIIQRCWDQDAEKRPSALELVCDLEVCCRVKTSMQHNTRFLVPSRRAQASAVLHQRIVGPCHTAPPFVLKVS